MTVKAARYQGLLARCAAVTLVAAGIGAGAGTAVAPAEVAPGLPGATVATRDVAAPPVREVGSWWAHGRTLDLRPDGTGAYATWHGAVDGTRIALRHVPVPGPAHVAEVVSVDDVGAGALAPDERPGVGALVTVAVEGADRVAVLEWPAGGDRHADRLCPSGMLDVEILHRLRCGA